MVFHAADTAMPRRLLLMAPFDWLRWLLTLRLPLMLRHAFAILAGFRHRFLPRHAAAYTCLY